MQHNHSISQPWGCYKKLPALFASLSISVTLCVSSLFLPIQFNPELGAPTLPVLTKWQNITLESTDNLNEIGRYFGISVNSLQEIMKKPLAAKILSQLQPGAQLSFKFSPAHALTDFRYTTLSGNVLILTYQSSQWKEQLNQAPFYQHLLPKTIPAEKLQMTMRGLQTLQDLLISREMLNAGIALLAKPVTTFLPIKPMQSQDTRTQTAAAGGAYQHSSSKLFFANSRYIKNNSSLYLQIQNIFKGVMPKGARLSQSQRFSVIYDKAGHILLATLTFRHQNFQAVRFTDSKGYTGYYSPSGQALVKSSFLAAPVTFTRISDPYTKHRWHPILHITRPHYGIDYAAASGSPIRAISNGRVSFTGWSGGYGNTVIITHGNRYQSLYAHIRRHSFAVKSGQWVKQGQIIAYVGSTGLATGPHLHFALYEYGQAINPATVLPKFTAPTFVAQRDFHDFLTQANRLLTQLAQVNTHILYT